MSCERVQALTSAGDSKSSATRTTRVESPNQRSNQRSCGALAAQTWHQGAKK